MSQILDSLPAGFSERILCCYVNQTSKVQIARITNIPNWYFERVVFPGDHLLFEASPAAQLEIHTGMMASAIHSDTIPCDRLQASSEGNRLNPSPKESRLHTHDSLDFTHKASHRRKLEPVGLRAS